MALDDGFRHEAFLYAGDGEFLAGTSAFIHEAAAAGEPTLVAVDAAKIAALQAVLDKDIKTVWFTDIAALGRNPARIIPEWRSFVDQHGTASHPLRGISEPSLTGRSRDELVECRRHEALLNHAFSDAPGFWLLCPYDTAALDPLVVDDAHDTHPRIDRAGQRHPSPRFHDAAATGLVHEPLSDPPASVASHQFGSADLSSMRRIAVRHAKAAGLADRAEDVALVASELATNSVRHGGGRGELRLWRQGATLICEVSDRGHLTDPLVGRRRPVDGQVGGRGLWVVNQISDLVQVRSSESGTTTRAHIHSNDSK